MNRIPFSVYDFFGYLASGFLFMVAVDYVIGKQWVLGEDLSAIFALLFIIIAYVIGQINAGIAAWLLERNVVGKWLGWPGTNLFTNPQKKTLPKLFPGYFTMFPIAIRKKTLEKAKSEGIAETGQTLFIHAFAKVKRDENTMARLNIFLNLYGFCRNISTVLLFASIMLIATSWGEGNLHRLVFALAAMVGAVGMFYRYLKFFRQYSYELFISYLVSPTTEDKYGD